MTLKTTLRSLCGLALVLAVGCDQDLPAEKPDQGDSGLDTEAQDTGEAPLACSLDEMAGTWTGFLDYDKTIPQQLVLEGSGLEGDVVGETTLDGSHYGEGYRCLFEVQCIGDLEGDEVLVYNAVVESVPRTSCIAGEYRLSLPDENQLWVVYIDEYGKESGWPLFR